MWDRPNFKHYSTSAICPECKEECFNYGELHIGNYGHEEFFCDCGHKFTCDELEEALKEADRFREHDRDYDEWESQTVRDWRDFGVGFSRN